MSAPRGWVMGAAALAAAIATRSAAASDGDSPERAPADGVAQTSAPATGPAASSASSVSATGAPATSASSASNSSATSPAATSATSATNTSAIGASTSAGSSDPSPYRVDSELEPVEGRERGEPRRERDTPTSVLGTTAVFIPGLALHGAGHMVSGDTRTGVRLLAVEGVGVGLLATGFLPIVLTGASRRVIGPAAALSVAGVGLFAISFLGDLYGVMAPARGTGAPFRVAPMVQTSLGYRYVYDPVFAYRHFLVQDIDYRTGPWRIHPSAWFAFDDTNARVRGHFAYRFIGPRPSGSPPAADGTYLDLEGAITRHSFTSNRFATTTGELAVAGRLDMVRLDPYLRGSFAEMSFGLAMQAYSYRLDSTTADLSDLLLARFAFGMYLGFPGRPRGEALVYYDHRHDGYAAGLKMSGLGSGVAGHFGAEARFFLTDHWGIAAEGAVGSAYVTGLSVLFRHGAPL